jgi:very-short-patch-repair endonuclease
MISIERWELMKSQYDRTVNDRDLDSYRPYSNNKVWWKCYNNHEWEATINSRSRGSGCPHCTGRTVADGNTLHDKHPNIAAEWHPIKNVLTPSEITPGSDKKVWWICLKNSKHDYESKISNRTKQNTGCPYCVGKKVSEDTSFATHYPHIASEWHPTKNSFLPSECSRSTGKSAWWICSKGHEWYALISNRIKGHNCSFCSGRTFTVERNLAKMYPHIIDEWHTKNDKRPDEYTPASHSKVWWRCSKNPEHEWCAKIQNRTIGNKTNCPKCNMSKLEIETVRVLNILNVDYDEQKIFSDLKQYRYDFFIPVWNTLIECDGIQHFENNSKFYKSKTNAKSFEKQQLSDKKKNDYALNNGYNILRIAYTEYNNIENILKEYSTMQKSENKKYIYPEHLYT